MLLGELENRLKHPPIAGVVPPDGSEVMVIYSPGAGSAFEKCWCWEKMALCCLKGERRGVGVGGRRSDIPAGL